MDIYEKKTFKKIIPVFCASVLLLNGSMCQAASVGATVSITTKYVIGKYYYGKQGQQLKVELYYFDKRTGTDENSSIHKKIGVTNGIYTSVSTSASARTGYEFVEAYSIGYVNGELAGASLRVKP